MNRTIRAILFALTAIILASPFLSSCSAPCNYPVARTSAIIRMLNSMPNMPVITVFINGKLFVQNFNYEPANDFGYLTTFKDGSPLTAGDSLLFVVTSDAAGKDTLLKQHVSINFNRQTVIVMGRGHNKAGQPKPPLIVRLDDQIDQQNPTQTLVRFVDAVPELDSLDIFYKGETPGVPLGKPDHTIHYGEVQSHIPLNNIPGLTITESGNPNNVIFSVPYFFGGLQGLFITAVVRGSSDPVGTEFIAAPIVLSDQSNGNFILDFKTFFVRLVNATRNTQLSLLLRSTYITLNNENTNPPRNNYPNQSTVLNIKADSISGYLPLNFSNDSIAGFWLSKTVNPSDTIASSVDSARPNIQYSKIAFEENIFSQPTKISYMNLPDTMTNPSGNFGRVRVIDLSPDHTTISVTSGSRTNITMVKKQVEFFDVPLTNPSITITDGATTKTYAIPVSAITPISVYILPEQSAIPFLPIATSSD